MSSIASPDRWPWAFLPGARHYLLALTFFVVTFALIPFGIYAHSGEDWGFPFSELLSIAALGLAMFMGAAVLIRVVAAVHARTASTVAVVLFCLGIFLLLAHVYAPIQIGPLDGTAIESAEPTLYSIVELALLAGVIIAFVQLQRGRGLTVAAVFSAALVLVAVAYAGVLAALDREVADAPAAQVGPAPTTNSAAIDGNVYHIVLDRMQTDAFLQVLEQTGAAEAFQGFELFENNVSNYLRTLQSVASYFTGTYFKGGDYSSWIRGWYKEEGLLPALADRGYRLWMYTPNPDWNSKYLDFFQYNVDIYEQETSLTSAGFYDLLHIWLASLAPNPLTNEALPVAATLADKAFELLTGRLRPLSGQEGLHPYASVMMLRRLVREEPLRAPDGEYVYAHAILPHGPLVLDRDCNYVGGRGTRGGPRRTSEQAFLIQAECTVGLVVPFLRELERLGRYEAATIVIHGDTGTWIPLGDAKKRRGRILGRPKRSLLSYVQALLMIKRPNAEGPLRVLETPTQLVDLYPTLLDLLDLRPSTTKVDGRSIYSKAADEPRETRVAVPPRRSKGPDLTEVRIEDPLNLARSKLTVIGPVGGSPAQRR